ncbi:MAG: ABC transporter ATP-binding protein [Thermodesulfobacteriota bacterium]|nr:ABC transporter ATP-binding protein/permease [bacterium]MEC7925124.1 ABC transporter ATP-binding protein [Thermodesulfobacteriota bacterium]|tara:strand:- start:3270 stop:5003 length:1734 start_codon:yes stop_codon:yes gene_type:complete
MKKQNLYSLLKNHKKNIFFGIIGLTMVDMMQLIVPILVGNVIDAIYSSDDSVQIIDIINSSAFYLIICGIIMAIFRFVWRFFLLGTSRRIEKSLRDNYFRKIQKLPKESYEKNTVGDFMARGVNDIETIKMACGFGIVVAYDGIVLLTFIFISMFFISPIFTLYASIPFIIMGVLILKYGDLIETLFINVQASFSKLTEEARKIIYSIRVIKSLNVQKDQLNNFKIKSKEYEKVNLSLVKIWAGYQPLITFFTGVSIFIFIFIGSKMVFQNEISIGEFSSLMVYLTMLGWPVVAMGLAVDWLKRGNACLTRVNSIILQNSEIDESDLNEIDLIQKISFNKVDYLENNKKILENLNFNIARGSSLGITGKTGSGKTSIANLILKNIYSKNIYFNDLEINDINKNSIREKVLFVPQNPVIFTGTIKDNVTFFVNEDDDKRVLKCLEISGFIKDLKNLTNGLDELVGERGVSLSGGQRQRLSIARALYQEPEVLIIDDTLSSLDVDTELQILKNLKKEYKEKFLIIISSRISTIYSMDNILVLDSGKIVESGNSRELKEKKGLFRELLNIQKILPGSSNV